MDNNPYRQDPVEALSREWSESTSAPDTDKPSQPRKSGTRPEQDSGALLPPPDVAPVFEEASRRHGVPVNVLMAIAHQESGYRPDAIGQPTQWGRAKGMMQYIDPTAQAVGINPLDPEQSIDAAARQYKKRIAQGYSHEEAIMAHHGGDDRSIWGPKTQSYAQSVLNKAGTIGKTLRERYAVPAEGEQAGAPGMIESPTLDPSNREGVKNADGSFSTIKSMSVNIGGEEVLIPTITEDGRRLSEDEAVERYRRTGEHLGKFDSPESATQYAKSLSQKQGERQQGGLPEGIDLSGTPEEIQRQLDEIAPGRYKVQGVAQSEESGAREPATSDPANVSTLERRTDALKRGYAADYGREAADRRPDVEAGTGRVAGEEIALGDAEQAGATEDEPGAIKRGFVTGLMQQNPEMTAETMEGLSHLAPEQFSGSFGDAAEYLRGLAEESPENYEMQAKGLFESGNLDEALTWAGEAFGQGVASTVPSIITGTAGGVVGQRAGGRAGGLIGAAGGAAIPSAALNYGEVYRALKDEGVAPEDAANAAAYAAIPMVALDTLSVGPIITRLGGLDQARKAAARGIARRIAAEGGKGMGRESITEASQEVVKDAAVAIEADKPFWTEENLKGTLEAGAAGAMVGGALGGAGGVRSDRAEAQQAPPLQAGDRVQWTGNSGETLTGTVSEVGKGGAVYRVQRDNGEEAMVGSRYIRPEGEATTPAPEPTEPAPATEQGDTATQEGEEQGAEQPTAQRAAAEAAAAQNDQPEGPITSAARRAGEVEREALSQPGNRVRVQTEGQEFAGEVVARDTDGRVEVQSDEGMSFEFWPDDPVQILPEQTAETEQEEQAADERDLDDLTEPELGEELRNVARQAEQQGGWTQRLLDQRREIEKRMSEIARQAEEDAPDATTPVQTETEVNSDALRQEEGRRSQEVSGRQFRRDGTPFGSREIAERAARNRRLKNYEVVEVPEGGWAIDTTPEETQSETGDLGFNPTSYDTQARAYVRNRENSLKPESLAKELGLEEGQARQVLEHLASQPESGVEQTKTGKIRRTPQVRGPIDAARFLADQGGVRDDEGHGLRQGRNLQRMTQRGPLIRNNGMSIDQAGEALWEAGYFGPPATAPRPDENQVLDVLERIGQGERVYTPEEAERRRAEEAAQTEARADQEARREINDVASTMGESLTDEQVSSILSIMARDGVDAEAAMDIFVERQAIQAANNLEADTGDPAYGDIPFEEAQPTQDGRPAGARGEGREGATGNTQRGPPGGQDAAEGRGPQATEAPVTEQTDQGEQNVLPGAEQESTRQQAERGMEGRQRGQGEQRGVDGLELFDPDSRSTAQQDIFSQPAQQKAAPDLRGQAIDDEWVRFSQESGTLGIPRAEMPQIEAEHRGALANFLKARGIEGTEETVPAPSLKPTQAEFSEVKVEKAKNFEGGDRAILASSDGHILDGHHQWVARVDEGGDIRIIRLDAPMSRLLEEAREFPSAEQEQASEELTPEASQTAEESPETGLERIAEEGQDTPAGMIDTEALELVTPEERYLSPEQAREMASAYNRRADERMEESGKARRSGERGAGERADRLRDSARRMMAIADELRSAADNAELSRTTSENRNNAQTILDHIEAGNNVEATVAVGRDNAQRAFTDTSRLSVNDQGLIEFEIDGARGPVQGFVSGPEAAQIAEGIRQGRVAPREDMDYARPGDEQYSSRAQQALRVLRAGGRFVRGLEKTGPNRRERARVRLNNPGGGAVRGIGESALRELEDAGLVSQDIPASSQDQQIYTLADEGVEQASTEAAGRIDDFGEVLEGARKHYAQQYREQIAEAAESDTESLSLSKAWPEPNYQQLVDDGVDPWVVGFVHAARDEVPAKPRKDWRVREWARQVEMLRDELAAKLLDGSITKEQLLSRLEERPFRRMRRELGDRADLYAAAGHEKSLRGVKMALGTYSVMDGQELDPPQTWWTVQRDPKATAFSNWPRQLAKGETREEAIEDFVARYNEIETQPKASKQVRFEIYSYRGQEGYWIGKKIGRDQIDLRRFNTVKEARQFLANNREQLEQELEAFRHIPNHRKENNAPRVGEDRRGGEDVTPERFSETFGFKGVQFGNYVRDGERQQSLNETYDALMDMAGVLNLPARALSLNGELGLAFGARGKGGRSGGAAHYEPDTVVINLTKNKGAGSLAHEWWHALDNYFSRQRGEPTQFMTNRPKSINEGVRPEMVQAFQDVIGTIRTTGMAQRSRNLDKRRTKNYWSTDIEMSARAFESYIIGKLQDAGQANDYLANIVSEEIFAIEDGYPYARASELPEIRAAFDEFFNTVEVQETDQGAAMYSISTGPYGRTDLFERDLESWRGQAERIINGQPVTRDSRLGRKFHVLSAMGEEASPLTLDASVAPEIRRRHPEIPDSVWRDLPELIADPLYVYPHRDGGMNVVLDRETRAGEPVVVGVRGGRVRTITPRNNRDTETGRESLLSAIRRARERGNKVYARDESALAELLVGADRAVDGNNPRNGGLSGIGPPPAQGRTGKVITRDDVVQSQGRVFYSTPARKPRSEGIPRDADPPIQSFRNTNPLRRHADFEPAKAGDIDAAARLVRQLVKSETAEQAAERFGSGVIYAAPHAEEVSGRNKIPQMLAKYYAAMTGADADSSIVQTVRSGHTGARAMDRLASRATFEGEVRLDRPYVLVDDVSTSGGTLAEMADFIQSAGGEVAGIVTLANSSRRPNNVADPDLVQEVESRFGDIIREELNIEPAALTDAEAYYLARFRDADTLRDRLAQARQGRDEQESGRTVRGPEANQDALTRDDLLEILRGGPLSDIIDTLVDDGRVVLHHTTQSLNPGAPDGVHAATTPDGTIHLVASALTPETATPVLLHEAFHSDTQPLIGTQKWNALQKRLGAVARQARTTTGRMNQIWRESQERIAYAEIVGVKMDEAQKIEEFGAYAIENYERAPRTLRKVLNDIIGHVKAWLQRRFGIQAGQLTPGQLRALAVQALRSRARKKAPRAGGEYQSYSISDAPSGEADQTQTPAFRRWFGDSKVVDESGRPLVVYHGTSTDGSIFDRFEEGRTQSIVGFFSPSAEFAATFSDGDGATVMPVYLRVERPFDAGSEEDVAALRKELGVSENEEVVEEVHGGLYTGIEKPHVIAAIQAAGFDGAYVLDSPDGPVNIAVFRPEQIKSATGNQGTFDPTNPDIRYSIGKPSDKFDDLDATQKSFLDKIGPETVTQSLGDRFRQMRENLALRVRQAGVDRYAALLRNDQALYGEDTLEGSIASSSWVLARMSNSAGGAVSAMLNHGRLYLDKEQKVLDIREGTTGLREVFNQLGSAEEVDRFMGWVAANRAKRLSEENRENLFTPDEIQAGISLSRGSLADGRSRGVMYNWAWQEFKQYRADVLEIAEQAGIITSEQRETWSEEFYVPFYRILDDDNIGGPGRSDSLARQQAYKQLKGGTQNLNDLLENTMMNFHHLLQASLKNQAALQAVENAEALDIATPTTEAQRDKKMSTFVLKNGERQWYDISDGLTFKALSALNHTGLNNPAMKILRGFKRLFTNMTTITPQFMVANMLRDSLSAMATSPTSPVPFLNAMKGGISYGHAGTRARMLASGASFDFGYVYGQNPDEIRTSLRGNMRRAKVLSDPQLAPGVLIKSWRAWNDVTNFAENVNRAGIWERNMERGKLRAAFESRDLMDFSAHGDAIALRIAIDTIPFLNARIQGLDKLYRSGVKPGAKTIAGRGTASDKKKFARFGAVIGALTVFEMLNYLNNWDDEEYRKLEDWQKDTYWIFRFGDDMFFVPKPFEVGAIATMAGRALEQYVDPSVGGEKFAERIGAMLTDTFSMDMPQAVKPSLEVMMNRDTFTDRPIEGMGMQRLSPSLRARPDSSFVAELASQANEDMLGAVGAGDSALSPVQIDHLIRGYLGQVGSSGVALADTIWRRAHGEEQPTRHWHEYQPIRRFYKDLTQEDYYTRYGTEFYEALKEADQAYADIQHLKRYGELEQARSIVDKKRHQLQLRKSLNRVQRDLSDINREMKLVQADEELSGEAKRMKLDRLRSLRNAIQERVGKALEERRAERLSK